MGQRAILSGFHFHNGVRRLGFFTVGRHFGIDCEASAPQPHGRLGAANHQPAAFDVAQQGAIEFHHDVARIGERRAHGVRRLALHQDGFRPVAVARVGYRNP